MQRKATKNTRGPNQAEKDFQAWLKQRPCCVSGRSDVQVHHCVGQTYKHNKELIGHWFCIPLSVDDHWRYHNMKKTFTERYGLQSKLWANLFAQYKSEDINRTIPFEVSFAIMDCGK